MADATNVAWGAVVGRAKLQIVIIDVFVIIWRQTFRDIWGSFWGTPNPRIMYSLPIRVCGAVEEQSQRKKEKSA